MLSERLYPPTLIAFVALATCIATPGALFAQVADAESRGRIFLPDSTLGELRAAVAADTGLLADYYRGIRTRAEASLDLPTAARLRDGGEMLAVSRTLLRVLSDAALVVLVEGDERYLTVIDRQLTSLAALPDWNPGHFLDAAELSLGVAVALDWVGDRLPPGHRDVAEEALARNVLLALEEVDDWWLTSATNWNQVCLTGILAAAYALEERFPNLSREGLELALDHLDYGLAAYAPDGVQAEGASYWVYGTSFTVLGLELLRQWRGESFGLEAEPGLFESAYFAEAVVGPRGQAYDYGDGELSGVVGGYGTLAWFATELQDRGLLSREGVLREARTRSAAGRLAALRTAWVAAAQRLAGPAPARPLAFVGGGASPVALIRAAAEPSFFLGVKGGSADVPGGQMDAGSFVFELDGVRWALDGGVRPARSTQTAAPELAGGAGRWRYEVDNELGHSTVRVEGLPHRARGFAPLRVDEVSGEVLVAMDSVLGPPVREWTRAWLPRGAGLRLRDEYVLDSSATVVWQWLTDVRIARRGPGELVLRSVARGPDARLPSPGGRALRLRLSDPAQRFEVVPLRPRDDPYALSRPGLKRIEVRVAGEAGAVGVIEVEAERGP